MLLLFYLWQHSKEYCYVIGRKISLERDFLKKYVIRINMISKTSFQNDYIFVTNSTEPKVPNIHLATNNVGIIVLSFKGSRHRFCLLSRWLYFKKLTNLSLHGEIS